MMAPRDYVAVEIPNDWRVADVGPGRYPLKRANVFIDRDPEMLAGLPGETLLASIEDGYPQIRDKAFDYVWCSHVLEHVNDPVACARTLSRISRRGTLVVPSAIKEAIFNFEEPTHQWLILPHPTQGPPIFIRQNREYIDRLKDVDIQKIACQVFRTGNGTEEDFLWEHETGRNWFAAHEPDLDIVVHWQDELKLQVIA
jgi:SAM-dependent methyltransferase